MTDTDQELISKLNKALYESLDLYSAAADSAKSSSNAAAFARIAKARAAILDHLTPFAMHGDKPRFYAFGSALSKVYPDMIAALDAKRDPALSAICRQTESELCELVRNTLRRVRSNLLRSMLIDLFPELNGPLVLRIAC